MKDGDLRILLIAGTGQNGATLLCRMLGRIPGFIAVGEIGHLWDRGLIENVECSCGAPFRNCPFWTDVGRRAFGGWDRIDGAEIARLRDSLSFRERRLQHPFALPFLLFPRLWPAYRRTLLRYTDLMTRLYRAVSDMSGADIIVDSMKVPAHVYAVTRTVPAQVSVAHLVRDPRGVAYSNLKWVERQGAGQRFRVRRPPRKTAIKWLWFNLSSHVLAATGISMTRVHYERMVEDPGSQLRAIVDLLGLSVGSEDLRFLHPGEVELDAGHLVAGNRMRLQQGRIPLRSDEAWRQNLPLRHRRLVGTLTWPLSFPYGYLGDRFRSRAP